MLAAMRAASWMAFEPLLESGDLRAERSARSGTKKSDHRHRRLLRPRRERQRRRAAEQRDELASFQLIELHRVTCQRGPNCRTTPDRFILDTLKHVSDRKIR
jgi:hypothetical protein